MSHPFKRCVDSSMTSHRCVVGVIKDVVEDLRHTNQTPPAFTAKSNAAFIRIKAIAIVADTQFG